MFEIRDGLTSMIEKFDRLRLAEREKNASNNRCLLKMKFQRSHEVIRIITIKIYHFRKNVVLRTFFK